MQATNDTEVIDISGIGNFQFSAVRMEQLDSDEYTLATVVCDISGSVDGFQDQLLDMIKTVARSCQDSPRSENLLLRVLTFNDYINEIHGFKLLNTINIDNDYKILSPEGMTALNDAAYDAVGATLEYSKKLYAQEFGCNGAVYIITDGMNNRSKTTPNMIKEKILNGIHNEEIESLITILIGVNNPNVPWSNDVDRALAEFKTEAGIDEFIVAGDATKETLSKLANYVSESISSQSQSLGSGGPSQILSF
jgi:uncharacterized protein YegL